MLTNLWMKIKDTGIFLQSILLLIIRLYWGYGFAVGGYGKLLHLKDVIKFFSSLGIPLPHVNALLVGGFELVGGILLILGLFSRFATIPLMIIMIMAYLTADFSSVVDLFRGNPDSFFDKTPFLFLYASIIVFCFGPGKVSLDYWITGAYRSKEMP
ncbi:MAG: DoxX family protein [Parachlamydiaceae bacterium]|nr:DoxX family protein [Parachlamydiaceae bacterium]